MLWIVFGSDGPKNTSHPYGRNKNRCAERPMHHIKPGSLVMIRHDNLHRYEWPLGKVIRVFPDPSGVIRTVEVEEGGRCSLRQPFLVPLELDCYDEEEGNLHGTERESDHNKAATSEAEEPPYNDEPIISGLGSPITLGVNSTSMGPAADMQLNGQQETPTSESADQLVVKQDSESPTHPSNVGATPNTFNVTGASGSQQPFSVSQELATQEEAAQSDESSTRRLPRRAAARQRQLIQSLINEDLL